MVAERGPLPPQGALFNIESWCFRREPSSEAPRLQSFRMREYVRIGTPEQIHAFREPWIERAKVVTPPRRPSLVGPAACEAPGRQARFRSKFAAATVPRTPDGGHDTITWRSSPMANGVYCEE